MTEYAHAKINIGLHILGKRPDGYHDIQSVLHHVRLHDTITFQRSDHGVTLTTNLPYVPRDERNLCVRAAQELLRETGTEAGVHIELVKQIPVGAGLGGGSSDAATVLRSLPDFLDLPVGRETIHRIAASLGSDIPFFLGRESAAAGGRGEILEYFRLELDHWIVIVYPGMHVSTRWAYAHLEIPPMTPSPDMKENILRHAADPRNLAGKIRNDFEPLIFRTFAEVRRAKEQLQRAGADFSMMSGSGSAVYGLFREESTARTCMDMLGRKYRVWLTPPRWHPG